MSFGEQMRRRREELGLTISVGVSFNKIFAKLGENGINIRMITQGPEELNIIVGVDSADFEKAIRVLYNSFVK